MKRQIRLVPLATAGLCLLLLAGCAKKEETPAEAPKKEAAPAEVKRNAKGETTLTLSEATQKLVGLQVEALVESQFSPEIRAYGRVLDAAPLAALVNELAAAQASLASSGAELARLKTLSAQNNASVRALENAEATARRDELLVSAAQNRLRLAWGRALAERKELAALVDALVAGDAALVRVSLPAGDTLKTQPKQARLFRLAEEGNLIEASFLDEFPAVDPQTQGRSFLFLVQPNPAKLAPGAAVTGFLPSGGEALAGVTVPRAAVVRHGGEAWIYAQTGGQEFTRRRISTDHPTARGWFVARGLAAGDKVVTAGAQTLLSHELGESGFLSGARD